MLRMTSLKEILQNRGWDKCEVLGGYLDGKFASFQTISRAL
jgi:hypothetical protein